MNSEPDLTSTIIQIIKPEFHRHIADWSFAAKPNEKKGLYLISKIMKYGGNGIFEDKETENKTKNDNSSSYREALIEFSKRSSSTTYKSSYTSSKNFVYKNIFTDKELKDMPYSKILTAQATDCLSKWIKLEYSENYKNHVLEFLRAIYSTINLNCSGFATIQKQEYGTYSKKDLFSSKSFFANANVKSKPINISIDEMRKNLKIEDLKEKFNLKYSKQAELHVGAYNYESQELINQKKQELMRGNKNLIKGVYGHSTTTSTYLELYKGYSNRGPKPLRSSESLRYVSGVKGKIPDPFMMGVQNSKMDIDDSMKYRITGMINSYHS